MADSHVEDLLTIFAEADGRAIPRSVVGTTLAFYLREPTVGAALVERLAGLGRDEEHAQAQTALETLMTEARMASENGRRDGQAFVTAVVDAVAHAAESGDLRPAGATALAACFLEAGLRPPEALADAAWTDESFDAAAAPVDLHAVLDEARAAANGDAYGLHAQLSSVLAACPVEARQALVGQAVGRGDRLYDRIGLYWLLDPDATTRAAAAESFLARVRSDALDGALAARLAGMRPWLPDDAGRATLDAVIKESRRRQAPTDAPQSWTVHRRLASMPDGVGAQSFAIVARAPTGERAIVMILLKQGFGVHEVFTVECESASEQKRIAEQARVEGDMQEASAEFIERALCAGLAERVATGAPPAHGLVDLAAILGFDALRPEGADVDDWIAFADPDGELAALSPQAFGRLVGRGRDLMARSQIARSWFENSADLDDAVAHAITAASLERAVWRHLESRREWWALLVAKAAATLRAAADADWRLLAATAIALRQGRPMTKTALMREVYEASLAAAEYERRERIHALRAGSGAFDDEDDFAEDDIGADAADDAGDDMAPAAPEAPGELDRLLRGTGAGVSTYWLSGFFAALAVSPKLVHPQDWVAVILDRAGTFGDEAEMQRFLDLILARYNNAIADEDAGDAAAALDAEAFCDWAAGFALAFEEFAWAWRGVAKDDKAVLKLLGRASGSQEAAAEVRPLLPTWLKRRRALRN